MLPGENVGLGKDHTIFALMEGFVKYRFDVHKKRTTISVLSCKDFAHDCEHKAIEARHHNKLDSAFGYLGLAKCAYLKTGEEGIKKLYDLSKIAFSIREKAEKHNLPLLNSSPRLPGGIGGYLRSQWVGRGAKPKPKPQDKPVLRLFSETRVAHVVHSPRADL